MRISRDPITEKGFFPFVPEIAEPESLQLLSLVREFLVSEGFYGEEETVNNSVLVRFLFEIQARPSLREFFERFAFEFIRESRRPHAVLSGEAIGALPFEKQHPSLIYVAFQNNPICNYDVLGLNGPIKLPPGFSIVPPGNLKDPTGFNAAVKSYIDNCKECGSGEVPSDDCLTICDAIWGGMGSGYVSTCWGLCVNCEMHGWPPFLKWQKKQKQKKKP